MRRALGFKLADHRWLLRDFARYLEHTGASGYRGATGRPADLPAATRQALPVLRCRYRSATARGAGSHPGAAGGDLLHDARPACGQRPAGRRGAPPRSRRRRPEQRSAEGVGEQVRQVAGGARAPVHGDDAGPLRASTRRGLPEAEASELLPHHPGDQARYHRGAQDVSCRRAGLEYPNTPGRPRIHDLRHTLAVRTLLDWYAAGVDVQARLPWLSTYLGHVEPSSTYWYLWAAPELMAVAAERLAATPGELP